MIICNACRYCEGYCAVWPAMERRSAFDKADLVYLANLCHDCRDCLYACQYAPPHQFAVNPPQVFAELRTATYHEYAAPRLIGSLLGRTWLAVSLSVIVVLLYILAVPGASALVTPQTGAGSFYRVIPYAVMVTAGLVIAAYVIGAITASTYHFWRETGARLQQVVSLSAFLRASADAFGLRYLGGEGVGCTYPTTAFSQQRRWLHHLVFYGFLLDLASTTLAAITDHVFGVPAPYPLYHPVVVLGTVGGVMLGVGCAGLLWQKWHSDRSAAAQRMQRMDVAFLVLLFFTSVTGLALLVRRDSAEMGSLLAVHLGLVAGLFLTMPYGKFVHAAYRYAALVRNAVESEQELLAG
ncbi:MAG: tricarballylate utilization 4Fe-4S protein TcuB [Chloroflexi bacterium]|nr:tricarballylate utilization 4Fe-4S protein TcuB [Chloroflexota bacterium]